LRAFFACKWLDLWNRIFGETRKSPVIKLFLGKHMNRGGRAVSSKRVSTFSFFAAHWVMAALAFCLALLVPQSSWALTTNSGTVYTIDCSTSTASTPNTTNLTSTQSYTVTVQNCDRWYAYDYVGGGISTTGDATTPMPITFTVNARANVMVRGYNMGAPRQHIQPGLRKTLTSVPHQVPHPTPPRV